MTRELNRIGRLSWSAPVLVMMMVLAGVAPVAASPYPVTNIKLAAPPSFLPTLSQTGGWNAKVPMKHGLKDVINGNEVSTHVLATGHGNLNIPFKISMNCAAGATVSHLSYKVPGQAKKTLIDSVTNTASYSKALKLRPFSKKNLETACRKAMGGDWIAQNRHNNQTKVVATSLNKKIQVWGQCSNGGAKLARSYPARVKLSCDDRSWITPVPARRITPSLR